MNQWLFNTLEAFIQTLVIQRDTLLGRRPAQAALQASNVTMTQLDKFCTAIRDYEGAPGDANYLNNNAGNCRYNEDGYLAKYEPVTKSPAGFAVFPSYQIGWEYLENMITGRIHAHPNWTLLTFMENYAPASDGNNPSMYAAFIGKRLGVDYQTFLMKNILV